MEQQSFCGQGTGQGYSKPRIGIKIESIFDGQSGKMHQLFPLNYIVACNEIKL